MEELEQIGMIIAEYDAEANAIAGTDVDAETEAEVETEEKTDSSNNLKIMLEKLKFERSLIALVGKQAALYDTRHPRFHDDSHKEELWQGIAHQLSLDLTKCLSLWAELRYRYQRHVRRLRNYRRTVVQRCGKRKTHRRRPVMLHEDDMMFLYDHVAKLPLKQPLTNKMPVESVENEEDDRDSSDIAATEIIDVDLMADRDVNDFHCTNDHRRLIEAVQSYPQLYDTFRPSYDNYRHRGLIWGSISNELRDKATKLMKRWLYLQTRYEWELSRTENGKDNSELWHLLCFLAPHIHHMPNSVCKSSLYLQSGWFDPIEHFRTVSTLINAIKSMPELLQLVDLNIPVTQKLPRYHELWVKVAGVVNCSYQRCEITWLTLRCFYQELSEMRKAGYMLQDKWYFENVIGSMYKQMQHTLRQGLPTAATPNPKVANKTNGGTTPLATFSMLTSPLNNPLPSPNPPRLPLAIVYPPTSKETIEKDNASTSGTSGIVTTSAAIPLPINPNITLSKIPTSVNSSSSNLNASTAPILTSSSGFANSTISVSSSSVFTPPSISTTIAPSGFGTMPPPIQMPSSSNTIQSVIRPGLQVILRPQANVATTPPVLAPIAGAPVAIIRGVPIPATPPVSTIPTAGLQNVSTLLGTSLPRMPKLVPIAPKTTTPTTATTTTMSTSSSLAKSPELTVTAPLVRVQSPSAINSGCDAATSNSLPSAGSMTNTTAPSQITPTLEAQSSSNKNDYNVELVDNVDIGNSIHVWNNSFHYHLSMPRTALFIREIMAIPQIHSRNPQLATKCADFWQQISKKFHMAVLACRATWNFLQENMSLFPHIAPMSELMRPFKTSIKVWEKSHRLFSKFDEIARKYQWMVHKEKLPALMQHFGRYEHLYWELRKPRPGEPMKAPQKYSDQDRLEVWRSARERFPNMNHRDIWSMFKFAFRTYMEDLERGIENPWPQNWWQALEQLKFLIEVRYHPLEPYYYIVHNKFLEEVKRCNIYESLMSGSPEKGSTICTIQTNKPKQIIMPWESDEAKRLLTGQLSSSLSVNSMDVDPPPLIHAPVVPIDGILDPRRERQPAAEDLVRHMERASRPLPTVSPFQLTRVLRRHPHTFEKATTLEKRTAWVRVAKDLSTTVTECRLSLQYALRELRILKYRDPSCRCPLSHKYYRHMGEIYRQVRPYTSLTVRSAHDLNQSFSDHRDTLYPERYIPEINMVTCKPSLVLKNLAYAMSSFSLVVQDELKSKLKQIFARYAEESHIAWPMDGSTKRKNNGTNNCTKRFKP